MGGDFSIIIEKRDGPFVFIRVQDVDGGVSKVQRFKKGN